MFKDALEKKKEGWGEYIKFIRNLRKEKEKAMRLNVWIAHPYSKKMILFVGGLLIFFAVNFLFNALFSVGSVLSDLKNPGRYINAASLFPDFSIIGKHKGVAFVVYAALGMGIAVWYAVMSYKINTYIGDKNFNVNQKGDSKWTTMEEIQEQYKEIPEKGKPFPGGGGVPVAWYKGKIYIDQNPVNNLIIGITRGGKGEMFGYPMIDIYSRAERKASMVITDLKLDVYPSAREKLIERGYDVYLFNLIDPNCSMRFNPLTLILDAYKAGRISDAEVLCSSFAYSIYNPNSSKGQAGDDKFWAGNSTSALSAMILAQIDDCLIADRLENKKRMPIWKEKQQRFLTLSEEEKEGARDIYFEMKEEVGDLDIVKEASYIPDDEEYIPYRENEKKINMFSIINTFAELAQVFITDNLTMLDHYFMSRPKLDKAKLKYASIKVTGDRTKGSVFSNTLNDLSVFLDDLIVKMTSESTFDLEKIGYGEKPIALFIGLPEYDKSKHFIATVLIRQLYFVLANRAAKTRSQKCDREVIFLMDEFGNLPPIENMTNIITMCLSRNIRFDLIIQSYAQVNSLYGDDADTIIDNCSNQIYIMTANKDTAETFSDLIGPETITNVSRMGEKLALKKNITESFEDKPLLNKNQLMELKEGECVVVRRTSRRDLQNNRVRPRPIFNRRENGTNFKYRYEYMLDDFPSGRTYLDEPMETNQDVDVSKITWDPFQSVFFHLKLKDLENEMLEPVLLSIFRKDRTNAAKTGHEVQYVDCNASEVYDYETEEKAFLDDLKNTEVYKLMEFLLRDSIDPMDRDMTIHLMEAGAKPWKIF